MIRQKTFLAFLIPLQLNVKLFISNSTWWETKRTNDATKRKFWVKIIFALESWKNQGDNDHSLWGLILWFSWPLVMLCKNKFHFHWHTSTNWYIKVDLVNSTHKLYSKELQKLLFEWKLAPTFMRLSKLLFSECGSKQRFYFWAKVVAAKYPANKWEA